MPAHPAPELTARQIIAALLIGSIGVLMVGVQPIVLGELVDARQVSLEGVGIVAMAEIIALGLGVVMGDAWLPWSRLRQITLLAALLAAGLDLLTLWAHGDGAMTAVRAATGLAEGVLIWGATGVVVRCPNPARVAGIFFVVQTVGQALLGAALANAVIPHWGWQGAFATLAVITGLVCVVALWQPARLAPLPHPSVSGFRWSVATIQPLLVAFLQLAALGSFWAYSEPLGKAAGLDARSAQTLIAGVLAMQVVGGSVASVAVRRLAVAPTLLACSALLAAITLLIHQLPAGKAWGFVLACVPFGFVWLFMLPFHVALAFQADRSGRLAGLVPAAQLLGSAFGPLTASFIVQGDNAGPVPVLSAGFAVAAALLLLTRRTRHSSLPST